MKLFPTLSNQHKPVLVFSLAAISYVFFFGIADGVAGGGDTYTHFFMSKYAGDHPELFLNQWGKPVFTTLFFPIAQLGFKAVLGFNLMLMFAQAGILFKIAKKINLQQNWLIPSCFSPLRLFSKMQFQLLRKYYSECWSFHSYTSL